jgi:hypothetical protein
LHVETSHVWICSSAVVYHCFLLLILKIYSSAVHQQLKFQIRCSTHWSDHIQIDTTQVPSSTNTRRIAHLRPWITRSNITTVPYRHRRAVREGTSRRDDWAAPSPVSRLPIKTHTSHTRGWSVKQLTVQSTMFYRDFFPIIDALSLNKFNHYTLHLHNLDAHRHCQC